MAKYLCPHLGSLEDRETVFEFPAESNTCYKASPPRQVNLDYQKKFCLGVGHQACPVFLANQRVPLPAAATAPVTPRFPVPPRYLVAALAAILLVSLGIFWIQAATRSGAPLIPETGGEPTLFSQIDETSPVDRLLNQTPQVESTTARPSCPMPGGWKSYTVQPIDSFSLLSRLYNINVDDLRTANCLEPDAVLQPGEVIYVPALLDPTILPPTATPTIRVILVNPTIGPSVNQSSNQSDPPESTAVVIQLTATSAPTGPPLPTNPPPSVTPQPQPTATVKPQPTVTNEPQPTSTVPPTSLPQPTESATQRPPDPTDPPAPPSPGSGSITVDTSGTSQIIHCDGAEVTIRGNNNDLTLLGTCSSLTVTGNGNNIDLENSTKVTDTGNGNDIQ